MLAHVVYVLTGFKIRFTFPDGKTANRETKPGDVLNSDAVAHASENIGDTDAHGILVELKTPAAQKAAAAKGKEGKEDELKRELLALAPPTQAESGNFNTISINHRPRRTNSCAWRCRRVLKLSKITRRRPTSEHLLTNARSKVGLPRSFRGSVSRKT